MLGNDLFVHDRQFRRLLARDPEVDLVTVALELARDADSQLDIQAALDWFEAQSAELRPTILRAKTEREAVESLVRHLGTHLGLRGDSESYSRPESSYLNHVIETGRGIPISLSIIYMGVADRIGVDLNGVSAPAHFLTRCETVDGTIFIDAFSQGRMMDGGECVEWVSRISRLSPSDVRPMLRATDARSIVIRMLNNLKVLHTQLEDWAAARKVQQRLFALKPGRYEEQRDLALLTARTVHTAEAIKLIQSCLQVCPKEERDMLSRELEQAQKRQAQWN